MSLVDYRTEKGLAILELNDPPANTYTYQMFREFDDAANAPLHGFAGADDYYCRASSLAFLSGVAAPTLCLSAEDDPFLPREVLARARRAAPAAVEFLVTRRGGHIGFVSGPAPWRARYFAEDLAIAWLQSALKI